MNELKVVLVDDNEIFRNALKNIIIKEYNAEIIGEASNSFEFEALQNYSKADIIFMDLMMPGTNGIALTKKVLWQYSYLKIIAVTMHVDKIYLNLLISAGFKGCINKGNLFNQIKPALEAVMSGNYFFPGHIPVTK